MSDDDSPNELRRALARNLRILRMDRGMSQRELATAADTSQRMVWEIESNAHNATVTMIGRLAEGLGVPPLDLLTPIR